MTVDAWSRLANLAPTYWSALDGEASSRSDVAGSAPCCRVLTTHLRPFTKIGAVGHLGSAVGHWGFVKRVVSFLGTRGLYGGATPPSADLDPGSLAEPTAGPASSGSAWTATRAATRTAPSDRRVLPVPLRFGRRPIVRSDRADPPGEAEPVPGVSWILEDGLSPQLDSPLFVKLAWGNQIATANRR
jgi:hypothetical protein